MSSLDEALSRQFREWEIRGRGGRLYDQPVALEPPFIPFLGYVMPRQAVDDGRRATALSRFWNALTAPEPPSEPEQEAVVEPGPYYRSAEQCGELQMTLPESKPLPASTHLSWLHEISRAGEPLTFELLGTSREIVPQFAGKPEAMERIYRALPQYVPDLMMLPQADALHTAWSESAPRFASVTLGLGCEFILPLRKADTDLLSAIVHAMDGLRESEFAIYQILVEPVVNEWAKSIVPAITTTDGKPIFVNRPELLSGAQRKLASPFLAVVIRLAACAERVSRCWEIIFDMAGPFGSLAQQGSNFLVPISNEGYAPAVQEEDILSRTSHRTGMLLNAEELVPLISLPTGVVSRRLRRQTAATRPAPVDLLQGGSLCLGENSYGGRTAKVWLSPSHRVRHMHVLGTSGMGKSTFLYNCIRQDIERGEGIALLDPHGDLVDRVLGIIPFHRFDDVVLVDPSDEEYVFPFNILAAHSDFERNLLASDLVSIFRRLSTSWGEQMNSVLRNAILAFLESSRGGTLADMRRFLLDATYRNEFLRSVTDPDVVFYWERAFPQLTGNKSIGPVLTRLDEFLSRKPIRYMVSQPESRVDFTDILDHSRILLVKLPQGQIGRENANLLGSVFVSKLHQMAISRQRIRESERRDFWVYLDEFHHFITPSMAEILSGARKYRVGLILAHQELHQLEADRDVASAVVANCCTRVAFRVSDRDARELSAGFAHFEPQDLQNLTVGDAICRVERSDADFNLSVVEPQLVPDADATITRENVTRRSNERFARNRRDVEAELFGSGPNKPREELSPPPASAPSRTAQPRRSQSPTDSEKMASSTTRSTKHATAHSQTALSTPPAEAVLPEGTAPQPPVISEAKLPESIPAPPKDLGRGGAQHQALQERIKAVAEELGFRAVLEKPILNGRGSIDVLLERAPHVIACEISITTTIDHEIGNVSKCFKAGFRNIAVVSSDAERLAKMRAAVLNSLGSEVAELTQYFHAEELLEYLQSLPKPSGSAPSHEMRRGYRIKRKIVSLPPDEMAAREQEALRIIGERLRKETSE